MGVAYRVSLYRAANEKGHVRGQNAVFHVSPRLVKGCTNINRNIDLLVTFLNKIAIHVVI